MDRLFVASHGCESLAASTLTSLAIRDSLTRARLRLCVRRGLQGDGDLNSRASTLSGSPWLSSGGAAPGGGRFNWRSEASFAVRSATCGQVVQALHRLRVMRCALGRDGDMRKAGWTQLTRRFYLRSVRLPMPHLRCQVSCYAIRSEDYPSI